MKLKNYFAMFLMGLMFGAQAVAGTAADAVSVNDPYVRAMPPGQPTSAGFMGITNNSKQDLVLKDAEGSVAKKVELHTHTMKDGMMSMHKVDKIDLPAGKMVMLKPGGLHVMLMGLKQDLKPGDNVSLTLVFSDGSKKQLEVPVRKIQMMMKKQDAKQHNKHMHH